MVDGVPFGVPLNEQDIQGYGYMYHNNEVLNASGVDPSTEIPTTWSELLEVCERVKASGFSCFSASFNEPDQTIRWWLPFTAVAETQSPMNYRTGNFSYADPARLRAWELLKTLYDNEHFIPGVESTDRDTSRQIFALGQAAFYMDGSWMPSVFRTGMGFEDLDYGVAAVPVPDDGVQGKLSKSLMPSRLYVTSQVSALTTVRIERQQLCALAVRRLLDRLETPGLVPIRVELGAQLIERKSVTRLKR